MFGRQAVCLLLLAALLHVSVSLPVAEDALKASCGYESCPEAPPEKFNVHLIAHTHDDAGWLKTVDQYYYGGRLNIQDAGVQYILDSVVQELLKDPSKRFIYVETSFLWQWWQEQDDAMRARVQDLVDRGQFEIISGAWSMNDEAVTHYTSIIDQFTWGLRVLNDTLGECARPRVGWQIDPFGHSREMASILTGLGFDGLFFGRLDHQDKAARLRDKTMEMIWQGSPDNLGARANIFTHAMYNFYFSPPGFCFDMYCNDDPMVDNKRSPEYNIPDRVQEFLNFVSKQAASYKTNNILVTMGGDFHYQGSHFWFKNIDKLIKYVNELQAEGSDVNVFYSTPSCYLKAVNEANNVWPTKTDDFFPYGSEDHAYWSGYFTSKPTIKYFERLGNNFLQVSKQVSSLAGEDGRDEAGITQLRQAMGILQHHDAITGTMKDHVAQDYARILHDAIQEAGKEDEAAINRLLYAEAPTVVPISSCLKLNVSECFITETSDSFIVTLYNPQSRAVTHYVRLPVAGTSYSVRDPEGTELTVQLVPLPSNVLNLPGRDSTATHDLVFEATNLPGLGLRSFYVTKLAKQDIVELDADETKVSFFGNERITITLNDDGSINSVNINGVALSLQQTYGYYLGYYKPGERASGAYIFRPEGTDVINKPIESCVVYKGALVEEAHQVFEGGWISQVIRVYKEDNHVEFEWMVGPILDDRRIGKEVISRFQTDMQTDSLFFTDSNGREMLTRKLNFRPSWTMNVTEPVASNYYPVTSKIQMKDSDKQVSILVDRAQGGSSLKDGQLELMIHRRLFHDDGYGVDEELNEQAYGIGLVARGKHYFTVGPRAGITPSLAAQERLLAVEKLLQPWTFFSPTDGSTFQQWSDTHSMEYSGLRQDLPLNVHILTLEPWSEGRLLLRLEHILEKSDDPELSATATVNLQELLSDLTVVSALETTLGANQELETSRRLPWQHQGQGDMSQSQHVDKAVDITAVTLTAMEIRTFIITVA